MPILRYRYFYILLKNKYTNLPIYVFVCVCMHLTSKQTRLEEGPGSQCGCLFNNVGVLKAVGQQIQAWTDTVDREHVQTRVSHVCVIWLRQSMLS